MNALPVTVEWRLIMKLNKYIYKKLVKEVFLKTGVNLETEIKIIGGR